MGLLEKFKVFDIVTLKNFDNNGKIRNPIFGIVLNDDEILTDWLYIYSYKNQKADLDYIDHILGTKEEEMGMNPEVEAIWNKMINFYVTDIHLNEYLDQSMRKSLLKSAQAIEYLRHHPNIKSLNKKTIEKILMNPLNEMAKRKSKLIKASMNGQDFTNAIIKNTEKNLAMAFGCCKFYFDLTQNDHKIHLKSDKYNLEKSMNIDSYLTQQYAEQIGKCLSTEKAITDMACYAFRMYTSELGER